MPKHPFLKRIFLLPRQPILFFIRVYQKTFSLDHGPLKHFFPYGYCKFYPSCSMYGYEAIKKYGIIKGLILALARILRCNPWNLGGRDDVPAEFTLKRKGIQAT